MNILILGSGTSVPLADRASPSVAIFIDGQCILMDIGPGTVRQLAVAGLKYQDIDHILISHFHPDHTADLIHFFFATRYPPVLEERKPFTIVAPKGFDQFLELLKKPYGRWLDLRERLMSTEELKTGQKDSREFDGFTIHSASVNHTPQSLGYRIEDSAGKSIAYSGDTGYCEGIVELARGADL